MTTQLKGWEAIRFKFLRIPLITIKQLYALNDLLPFSLDDENREIPNETINNSKLFLIAIDDWLQDAVDHGLLTDDEKRSYFYQIERGQN